MATGSPQVALEEYRFELYEMLKDFPEVRLHLFIDHLKELAKIKVDENVSHCLDEMRKMEKQIEMEKHEFIEKISPFLDGPLDTPIEEKLSSFLPSEKKYVYFYFLTCNPNLKENPRVVLAAKKLFYSEFFLHKKFVRFIQIFELQPFLKYRPRFSPLFTHNF